MQEINVCGQKSNYTTLEYVGEELTACECLPVEYAVIVLRIFSHPTVNEAKMPEWLPLNEADGKFFTV